MAELKWSAVVKVLVLFSLLHSQNQVFADNSLPPAIVTFTLANTDVGTDWELIPFRERYVQHRLEGPCRKFSLKIPHDQPNRTTLDLCIFRTRLESSSVTPESLFAPPIRVEGIPRRPRPLEVQGYVLRQPLTSVRGYLLNRYFYGEVRISGPGSSKPLIYYVEEATILPQLMNNNLKLLKSLLYVKKLDSQNSSDEKPVFNAVVTKGISLRIAMQNTSFRTVGNQVLQPGTPNFQVNTWTPKHFFVAFSSDEHTLVMMGLPTLQIDNDGRLALSVSDQSVAVENDGFVTVKARQTEYRIRPAGSAVAKRGTEIEKLQEHAGSVAVMALSPNFAFNCLLPPPSFTENRPGAYLCRICVLRDESFRKFYELPFGHLVPDQDFLFHVIDRSSWIFRSVDWDADGRPDNIGLLYDDSMISDWNPEYRRPGTILSKEELDQVFHYLSQKDFSHCCLAVAYTMEPFPQSLFSISSPSTASPFSSGICAAKNPEISSNVILLSANKRKGHYSPMDFDHLVYLTTHEIAKSFGAPKEITGKESCDQFKDKNGVERHHIMWPEVMRNITDEEKTFSSCTIKTVYESLSSCKTSCFEVDTSPFCGNGIVEDGEDCDCGMALNCSKQLCCFPRGSKFPCRKTGAICPSDASKMLATFSFTVLAAAAVMGRILLL